MNSCLFYMPGLLADRTQPYDCRLHNNMLFERYHGSICPNEAVNYSVNAQQKYLSRSTRYRVIDFFDCDIALQEQDTVWEILNADFPGSQSKKPPILLVVSQKNIHLAHFVMKKIKSFSNKRAIFIFLSRTELREFFEYGSEVKQ